MIELKMQYEEALKVYRDWKNTIDTAVQKAERIGMGKGKAEGKAEGIAEGKAESQRQTAINLKKIGLSVDVISQATGLPADEINKL